MSDLLLGGMLPRRWHWDPAKVPWVQILLNWQEIEIDDHIYEKLPIVRQIAGHRRKDVMNFCTESFRIHWDEEITRSIYGYPGACS